MFGRISAWAVIGVLATGCAATDGVGESEERQTDTGQDIVGGHATSSFAAVGALARWGGVHCTGTLVAPRKVLTAAHCLEGVSPSSLKFVLGASFSQAEAVIAVTSVTPHPSYDDWALKHDIGYVTLAQDAPVEPMGIVEHMDSSWVGRELVFVGYGHSNGFSQSGGGVKRVVTMPISQVGATQFSYAVSGKNTCNGDSGGPAFAQSGSTYLLAGVTSYGDQNCVQYGVDTRVDVYADFVGAAPAAPPDPCQGESYEGRCDGNTVIWCEQEKVHSYQCQKCGWDAAKGFYNCI